MDSLRSGHSRPAWTIVDAGAWSAASLAINVAVARTSSTAAYAEFAVQFLALALGLGALRAVLAHEVLLVGGLPAAPIRRSHLRVGATLALTTVVTATVLSGSAEVADIWFAVAAPLGLAADYLRLTRLGGPELPRQARWTCLWAVAVALPSLLWSDPDVAAVAWAAYASASAALVLRQSVRVPTGRPAATTYTSVTRRDTALDWALSSAALPALGLALPVVGSPADLAGYRGAQTLLGPGQVLQQAVETRFLAGAGTRGAPGREDLRAGARAGAAVGAVVLTGAALVPLLPEASGEWVLGDSWASAAPLVPLLGARFALGLLGAIAIVSLRARARVGQHRKLRVAVAAVTVLAGLAGGAVDGARGLVVTLVVTQAVATVLWWQAAVSGTRPG